MTERAEKIENALSDLVSDFLYYDRKGDEELGPGEIEAAIEAGEIRLARIMVVFMSELERGLKR